MSDAALTLTVSSPADIDWAAGRIGVRKWPDDSKGISIKSQAGELRAVVVYNCFFDGTCSAHIASDGKRSWATRGVLWNIFYYPFGQLQLRRITLPIAAKNRDAIILAIKLGFRFEGLLRDARPGDDEVLMGMKSDECRWLKEVPRG